MLLKVVVFVSYEITIYKKAFQSEFSEKFKKTGSVFIKFSFIKFKLAAVFGIFQKIQKIQAEFSKNII